VGKERGQFFLNMPGQKETLEKGEGEEDSGGNGVIGYWEKKGKQEGKVTSKR